MLDPNQEVESPYRRTSPSRAKTAVGSDDRSAFSDDEDEDFHFNEAVKEVGRPNARSLSHFISIFKRTGFQVVTIKLGICHANIFFFLVYVYMYVLENSALKTFRICMYVCMYVHYSYVTVFITFSSNNLYFPQLECQQGKELHSPTGVDLQSPSSFAEPQPQSESHCSKWRRRPRSHIEAR